VNADGSLMGIPPSAIEHLHELGVDEQPSAEVTHYSSPSLEVSPGEGVSLADGLEERAHLVVSAADGHGTIFDMLGGPYLNETIRTAYETLPRVDRGTTRQSGKWVCSHSPSVRT